MASSVSSQQIVTPAGVMSYVNVWKARAHPDSPDSLKFSVTLIFNKTDDLVQIQAMYDEVLQGRYEGALPYGARNGGLIDGAVRYPNDPFYADKMLLSLSQDEDRFNHTNVVGADNQPILDKSQIYSGAIGHALMTFYSYDGGTGGIKASLHGLMKVADGEHLGGGAVDAKAGFAQAGLGQGAPAQTPPAASQAPPTQSAPPVAPPTAPAQSAPPAAPPAYVMTAQANGATYEQMLEAKWTHEQMVAGGMIQQ